MAKPGVSRNTKKVAKKTAPKKRAVSTPKKSPAAKKSVAKKVVKKTTRKKVVKKATTKEPSKKAVKKANIKIAKEKVASKSANKLLNIKDNTETETVAVPESVSLRAKRKAEAIADLVTKDFADSAWKVAYAAGVSFVLLGAFAGMTGLQDNSLLTGRHQAAQVSGTSSSTQPVSASVNLISPIPQTLTDDNWYLVETLGVEIAEFYLFNQQTGNEINLNTDRTTNINYKVEIKASSLDAGQYQLKVDYVDIAGNSFTGKKLALFEVPGTTASAALPVEIDLVTDIPDILDVAYAVDVFVLNASGVKGYLVDKDVPSNTRPLQTMTTNIPGKYRTIINTPDIPAGEYELYIKGIAVSDDQPFEENLGAFEIVDTTATAASSTTTTATNTTSNTGGGNTTTTTNSPTSTTTNTTAATDDTDIKIELKIYSSEFVAPDTVHIFAPLDSEFVRLYYRSELTSTLSPMGYAIKGADRWLYRLDPSKYPNGIYYITANAKYEGDVYKSPSKKIKIAVPVQTVATEPVLNTATNPTPTALPEADSDEVEPAPAPTPVRAIAVVEPEDFDTLPDDEATEETLRLFDVYKTEIDSLLKKYAVAVQSGDSILIEDVRKQLVQKREEIISQVLLDSALRDLADRINERLSRSIDSLQTKVETFEALRKTESANESAIDTDGDGISDVDERILYKTDPNSADSDGDGITDGVEVLRGFNPTDSSPEALVQYESPKESIAYIAEETLRVRDVKPLVRLDAGDSKPPVSAEISGNALPNSFVTLYIFSTPTVVTVKTDADGSFVYTFDDELEDGEHEVYVAVTDNTGAIVAQSNPFRFVKEAQAFTPQDEEVAPVVSNIDETISSNPYISVLGLGILGLGLVLLMLGFALRTTEPKQIIQEDLVA